jgi:hypothetical protein
MATRGIYFGGRTILIPGAYAQGDASDLVEITVGALNIVMLVGESEGGEPNTPLVFNAAGQDAALAVLRGGPLYEAARATWNPSPSSAGADVVIAVRVNPAVRASHTFLSGAATPDNCLTVRARDYGKHGNNAQIQILAGTADADARIVKVRKLEDGVDQTSPELGKVLGLAYTGNGTATAEVVEVYGEPRLVLSVTGATDGSASFTKTLTDADVATIAKLAGWLNAQTGFTTKVFGHDTMASALLDRTAAPVPLSSTPTALRGVNGAIADWLNRFSPAAIAEVLTLDAVAPAGPVFLSGGGNGAPTLVHWKNALKQLESQPGYFLVPCTGDALVHQACLEHVLRMSDIKIKRRRQLWVGHDPGLVTFSPDGTVDFDALEAAIFTLNSERCVYATPGIYRESGGAKTLFGSWLLAAALAGMKAGGMPQESLTFKYVSALAVEGIFDSLEQEQAILAAATPLVPVPNKGFQVVLNQFAQTRTTNVLEVEPSVLHCADTLLTNLEMVLGEKYTGKPVTSDVTFRLNQIKGDTEKVLAEARRLGMLVGDAKVTRVTYQNRTYAVELKAAIAEPGNYITIAAKWQAVQGSV